MPARHEVTVEGERVVAVHHEAPTENWLFFCHGFQSDKSGSYESRCERAVEDGYNAVRFDFRGCGESDRAFDEQTVSTRLADLQAVVTAFDPPTYTVFGSSLGGKVALHTAAADDRVEAVATRAPVTYNRAFAEYRRALTDESGEVGADSNSLEGNWVEFFEDFDQYRFVDAADEITVPVVVFHGRADDSVPVEDSIEATGELGVDVSLHAYAGEGHLFSREAEARMRDRLFEWL